MADKHKKQKFAAKREARRKKWEQDSIHLTPAGKPIPQGAVPVDPAQLAHWNTYSPLPEFYHDQFFNCRDCGRAEVWTADRQKWYFEVAKGKIGGRAIRCRACRRNRREQESPVGRRGDPFPIKHPGVLMKRVREALLPALTAAGYSLQGRGREGHRCWFDFERGSETLAFSYRRVCRREQVVAEYSDSRGEFRTIAEFKGYLVWIAVDDAKALSGFYEAVREFVGESSTGQRKFTSNSLFPS